MKLVYMNVWPGLRSGTDALRRPTRLQALRGETGGTGVATMSKSEDKKKEPKKKPTKTLKEKRAEKKAKKEGSKGA
jgi:hypothetical protein